jgi:superfamily II DNA or RNA helicase
LRNYSDKPSLVIAKHQILDNFKQELAVLFNNNVVEVEGSFKRSKKKRKVPISVTVDSVADREDCVCFLHIDDILHTDAVDDNYVLNKNCVIFCPTSSLSSLMSAFAHSPLFTYSFFQEDKWLSSRFFLVNANETEVHEDSFSKFAGKFMKSDRKRPISAEKIDEAVRFFMLEWGLVVMDEAQDFKNPGSHQTSAVSFIRSDYRLALSGTPSQNDADEMINIIRYALHYCPRKYPLYDVESLFYRKMTLSRSAKDVEQKNTKCNHYDVVISMEGHPVDRKVYLRQLLSVAQLHRNLEDIENHQQLFLFVGEDKETFRKRAMAARQKFFTYSDALMRCCLHHREYTDKVMDDDSVQNVESVDAASEKAGSESVITGSEIFESERIPVNYTMPDMWSPSTHSTFPFWFKERIKFLLFATKHMHFRLIPRDIRLMICSYVAEAEKTLMPMSPKLEAIYEIYKQMQQRNATLYASNGNGLEQRPDKLVIMSRARSFLENIVSPFFKERSIGCLLLCGDSNLERKKALIEKFTSDHDIQVLCATTQVAGEGLNLQHASATLILCEPGWHVKKDRQAVARICRMGQTRETYVYRLVIAGSVDIALLKLQEEKERVCNAVTQLKGKFAVNRTLRDGIDFDPDTALRPKIEDAPVSFVNGGFVPENLRPSAIFDEPEIFDQGLEVVDNDIYSFSEDSEVDHSMDNDVNSMDKDVKSMDNDVKSMEREIKRVKLEILENIN